VFGDVFEDRTAVRTLLAGAAALFASGIDPRIWSPQLSTVQAAVRAQPGLETTILVNGLIGAIVLRRRARSATSRGLGRSSGAGSRRCSRWRS
jgi:hypothetical protein